MINLNERLQTTDLTDGSDYLNYHYKITKIFFWGGGGMGVAGCGCPVVQVSTWAQLISSAVYSSMVLVPTVHWRIIGVTCCGCCCSSWRLTREHDRSISPASGTTGRLSQLQISIMKPSGSWKKSWSTYTPPSSTLARIYFIPISCNFFSTIPMLSHCTCHHQITQTPNFRLTSEQRLRKRRYSNLNSTGSYIRVQTRKTMTNIELTSNYYLRMILN